MTRLTALAGLSALLLLSSGCDDPTGGSGPPERIELSADSLEIVRDSTTTVTARLLDARGRAVRGRSVQWRSSAPEVAGVDAGGKVRGVGFGSAHVVASYTRGDGHVLEDSAKVVVRPALAAVHVDPVHLDVTERTRREVTVRVLSSTRQPVPGAPVRLSVVRGTATVTPESGTTGADGTLTVSVEAGAAPDTVVVEARSPWAPSAATFRATVHPAFRSGLYPDSMELTIGCNRPIRMLIKTVTGQDLLGQYATFSVTDSTVVSLAPDFGTGSYRGVTRHVAGRKLGSTQIVATWKAPVGDQSITDTASVRVVPSVPSRVAFSWDADSVGIGGRGSRLASVRDQCGVVLPDQPVSYRTPDTDVLRVIPAPPGGYPGYEGLKPGTARVIAESGSFADTLLVKVKNVRILPADTTVAVGAAFSYRIVKEDASGNLVPASSPIFSQRDLPAYALTKEGQFTARAPIQEEYLLGHAEGVFVGTRVTIVP